MGVATSVQTRFVAFNDLPSPSPAQLCLRLYAAVCIAYRKGVDTFVCILQIRQSQNRAGCAGNVTAIELPLKAHRHRADDRIERLILEPKIDHPKRSRLGGYNGGEVMTVTGTLKVVAVLWPSLTIKQ